MPTRRQFMKYSGVVGAGALLESQFGWMGKAFAIPLAPGLSDPAVQPKFEEYVPNALDPGFLFGGICSHGIHAKLSGSGIHTQECSSA